MYKNRRRHHNPFRPELASQPEKLAEAAKVIEIITQNAVAHKLRTTGASRHNPYNPAWDETILNSIDDPENIFTPLNLVAHSIDPKTSDKLLKLLLAGETPGEIVNFYGDIIDGLEKSYSNTWFQGENMPDVWFDPDDVRFFGDSGINTALRSSKFMERADQLSITTDRFREELGGLPKPQRKRKLRRKRR